MGVRPFCRGFPSPRWRSKLLPCHFPSKAGSVRLFWSLQPTPGCSCDFNQDPRWDGMVGQAAERWQELGPWPQAPPAPTVGDWPPNPGAWQGAPARPREPVRFMGTRSAPSPKCKSKAKQIRSNQGHQGRGQAGARSLSADDAIRRHKPPASCFSRAMGAGGRQKRPAGPAGFTRKSFFLPPPIFPPFQWVPGPTAVHCHEDDGRNARTSLLAGMGRTWLALPVGTLLGSESQRGSGTELWQRR